MADIFFAREVFPSWMKAALASILGCLVSFVAVTLIGSAPRNPAHVAVMFPPWWNASQIFDAASEAGSITAIGSVGNILVVTGEPENLVRRLRHAGALFVFDPQGAGGCLISRGKPL